MKKIKYIILITLAIIIIMIAYTAIKRPDIKYGIMTLFDKRQSITLEELDIVTQKVDISDIEEGKYNNIKYTMIYWRKFHEQEKYIVEIYCSSGYIINSSYCENLFS